MEHTISTFIVITVSILLSACNTFSPQELMNSINDNRSIAFANIELQIHKYDNNIGQYNVKKVKGCVFDIIDSNGKKMKREIVGSSGLKQPYGNSLYIRPLAAGNYTITTLECGDDSQIPVIHVFKLKKLNLPFTVPNQKAQYYLGDFTFIFYYSEAINALNGKPEKEAVLNYKDNFQMTARRYSSNITDSDKLPITKALIEQP
jgi:hypothetical protein